MGAKALQSENFERRIVSALFLTPVMLLVIVFFLYSIVTCFGYSFRDWNGMTAVSQAPFTYANWLKLFSDMNFWKTVPHNFTIMVGTILIEMPVSMALACFLYIKGRRAELFKIVWFIPLLMSSAAIGTLSSFLYNNYTGPIAQIVKMFGGKMPSLLGNPDYAIYVVCFTMVWQYAPFYMMYYFAGLNSISDDIYEAAIIDGATRGQYIFRCAIPIIAPTIKTALVLQIVGALKSFDMVYTMTMGGPSGSTELMATYMYKNSFVGQQMGYGSAIACMMFIIITVVSLASVRILNGKERG